MLDLPHYLRDRLGMHSDPLSEFLHFVNARSVMSGGLVAGGAWAIAIPAPDTIKFWGVARGSCWLSFDDEATPILLEEGDVFLSSRPRSLVIASDLCAPRVDLSDVLKNRVGATVQLGSGDDCYVIVAGVELSTDYDQLFLDAIPATIHVRGTSRQAQKLSWLMDELIQEREDDPPGSGVASAQLAHLMFIQTLRAHFVAEAPLNPGWLRAVTDKRIAPALRLMHGDPGYPWQLEALAKAAAMSRATFALHFKTVAGVAPMTYLTHWRMRLAERALRETRTSIGEIGRSFGYTSESAFSSAFKRVTGRYPLHFRRLMTQQQA